MQYELLNKITDLIEKIDQYVNIEDRYYIRDFILNNLDDEEFESKAIKYIRNLGLDSEQFEQACEVVKNINELIEK